MKHRLNIIFRSLGALFALVCLLGALPTTIIVWLLNAVGLIKLVDGDNAPRLVFILLACGTSVLLGLLALIYLIVRHLVG